MTSWNLFTFIMHFLHIIRCSFCCYLALSLPSISFSVYFYVYFSVYFSAFYLSTDTLLHENGRALVPTSDRSTIFRILFSEQHCWTSFSVILFLLLSHLPSLIRVISFFLHYIYFVIFLCFVLSVFLHCHFFHVCPKNLLIMFHLRPEQSTLVRFGRT